jgi:preprotein translocase subunit SecG
MEKLQLFLLIFQVIIAIVMIISILIQRTGGDSLGGIGGGSGGIGAGISARTSANALTKFTIILVALFMLNSLILARISGGHKVSDELQIDKVIKQEELPKNSNPSAPPVE